MERGDMQDILELKESGVLATGKESDSPLTSRVDGLAISTGDGNDMWSVGREPVSMRSHVESSPSVS